MSKETIAIRVPNDTFQRFEEYREDAGGISKADAGRRLLERGLDYEEGVIAPPAGAVDSADDANDRGGGSASEQQDGRGDEPVRAGGDGFLDRVIPSFVAVFAGVAVLLLQLGQPLGGGYSALLSFGGVLGWSYRHPDAVAEGVPRLLADVLRLPESVGPDQPTTRVERIAGWDRRALAGALASLAYTLVVWGTVLIAGGAPIVAVLGEAAALVVLLVAPVALMLGSGVTMWAALLANVAVETARNDSAAASEACADADQGSVEGAR